MLDRESTFADPEIIKLLTTKFVPVAIDQAYQRRQKDTEGDFYRKIAGKSPRGDGSNGGTTQGLYVSTPEGVYLGYSNHRDPERIKRLLMDCLGKYRPAKSESIKATKIDARYNPKLPTDGLVVRVQSKVLSGYAPTENRWQKIFQTSISRDNLWISKSEHEAIAQGTIPDSVQRRIARFHLVDNTRGEPPMWQDKEIRKLKMEIQGDRITGSALLHTDNNSRGYDVDIVGTVKVNDGKVVRLDMVARGDFWGEGPYTRNAPKGKFPLAVTFRLADGSDVADGIPPQGSRGWLTGYLQN